MKVKMLVVCFFSCLILTSCGNNTNNNIEIEYLDYDDYTLVTVITEGFWDGRSYYGYIYNEDYEKYKNGEDIRILTIKNPFIEDKETTITAESISSITTGVNEFKENSLKEDILNNSLDK